MVLFKVQLIQLNQLLKKIKVSKLITGFCPSQCLSWLGEDIEGMLIQFEDEENQIWRVREYQMTDSGAPKIFTGCKETDQSY